MAATRKITVEVPEEIAVRLERRLEAGAYASESDMVTASLEAQLDSDEQLDRWLRDEIRPAYDEWRSGDDPGIPADEAFAIAKARNAARKTAG